jgi:hypothetical protein
MLNLFRRPALILSNLLIIFFLLSCEKEEVVPQTGNLIISFTYVNNFSTTYRLYTEGVWTSAGQSAEALREGPLPRLASNATSGQAKVQINNLNAGNYVFVVGSDKWSVQVVAGETTQVSK